YVAALSSIIYWLSVAVNPYGSRFSWAKITKLGVGKPSDMTLINSKPVGNFLLIVMLANLVQPGLSFVYFSYNGLFTSMATALEWDSYARNRKGLRVSKDPQGKQREYSFLQLPYKFAVPLLLLSGLLHWLVSQSLFLITIDSYAYNNHEMRWEQLGQTP